MSGLTKILNSSITKKFLMAVTGLAWVGFVISHLLGNLTLYLPGGQAFNEYAYALESLGVLLYVAEIGLVLLLLTHVFTAINLRRSNAAARTTDYAHPLKSKGGPSKSNASSLYMIISGSILLIFLVFHIWHFKYGPGVAESYVVSYGNGEIRDLYRLVVESFKDPAVVIFYSVAVLFLGLHLRHGFWSAFQSLGLIYPGISNALYSAAIVIATLLAFGFLFIPVYIYFFVPLPGV